tara:strand:+ start:17864 stop:18280 length:417 start_codon:yes stop_codon:yes gene_type:complete
MSNDYARRIFDTELELKAAGLLAATTSGSILDLGEGLVDGEIVIDLTACEIATGDEIYTVSLEMSNVVGMATGSSCAAKKVFGNLVIPMDGAIDAAGRYILPFRNEEAGVTFQYVRLHTLVAGTIATGINYSAFLAKR